MVYYRYNELFDMGNLETGPVLGDTIPIPISAQEFLGVFPEMGNLEQFPTFKQFKQSDFFDTFYKVNISKKSIHWIHEIDKQKKIKIVHSDSTTQQVEYLGSISQKSQITSSKNLQRMLIALGYLTKDDFFPDESKVISGEIDETDISQLGFLGTPERKAVLRFQKHEKIQIDAAVGEITSSRLFQRVFELFHKQKSTPDTPLLLAILKNKQIFDKQ